MDTKVKLKNALKEAMRAGDGVKKRTVRMALAPIKCTRHEFETTNRRLTPEMLCGTAWRAAMACQSRTCRL